MNDKSIIGFGYKPNNVKAVCLKTNSTTRLGDVEYKIIADPYEREFVELEPVPLSLFGEKKESSAYGDGRKRPRLGYRADLCG